MVAVLGFEPSLRSDLELMWIISPPMHHTSHGLSGCRGGTRTHILSINNRALDQFSYPTKLGWPGENRTRYLTIKDRLLILLSFRPMVAMAGLEPAMTRLKDG
jgi:hypothetical protein